MDSETLMSTQKHHLLLVVLSLCLYLKEVLVMRLYWFNHRPLHSYMDRNGCSGVYHRGPTFLGLFVTKPVVTQGTHRCQMKDMNKIFPEIPYELL